MKSGTPDKKSDPDGQKGKRRKRIKEEVYNYERRRKIIRKETIRPE